MAEEEIASYSWRLPLDEWSPLCDNILKLNRSGGLSGTPMRLNSSAICSPPCEMCVTAIDPGGCELSEEYSDGGNNIELMTLTACDQVPAGKSYRFQFAGGGSLFTFDVMTATAGEQFAADLAAAMQDHALNQGPDGYWEAVSVSADGLTVFVAYGVDLTGRLTLTIAAVNP